MDRSTFDSTIRACERHGPFHPFTVSPANGDRLEFDHPDALAIRDDVASFAGPGRVPAVFEIKGIGQVIGEHAIQEPNDGYDYLDSHSSLTGTSLESRLRESAHL